MDLKEVIEQSFSQYSGAVLQSRALVDVRDCLKPSARQIFYSMYKNKLVSSKPFKKTNTAVGLAMADFYIHGDSSCEAIIIRAGQPFSMRYPLVEVEGSYGNLIESGNWAAPRYTSSRLSPISNFLFEDIQKETIDDWRDNYADTDKYPSVLTSKGFYNIVNGTVGIGVGAASSIPQFNLAEVNEAMSILIKNPNASFDEIYCAPDFSTGGTILNGDEVKESLRVGSGKSCKIRAKVVYSEDENCLIVKEIPFGVYTNTICKEMEALLVNGDLQGVERFNDLTGSEPNIKIYLTKKANPEAVLKFLYKKTSLESFFGINMTMLDDGRFPKVFSWKEALQAHISHEKVIYKNGYCFDLEKIIGRIHIIEGILIAIANIEEVISIIKKSSSTIEAKEKLMVSFVLSENQAKAILAIKLSQLAHLEVEKYEKEKSDLEIEKERIEKILNDEGLFNDEIIKGWQKTSEKFSSERKTKILNLTFNDSQDKEDTPIEIVEFNFFSTNFNNCYLVKSSSLLAKKRTAVGTKFKLEDGEFIAQNITLTNENDLIGFTNFGNMVNISFLEMEENKKFPFTTICGLNNGEIITTLMSSEDFKSSKKYLTFITKSGIIKKSNKKEYLSKRTISAIKLREKDEVVGVFIANDSDKVLIATNLGQGILLDTNEIRPIGRNSIGVKAISLKENDFVVSASLVTNQAKEFLIVTKEGFAKRIDVNELEVSTRGGKGIYLHRFDKGDNDSLICAKTIENLNGFVILCGEKTVNKTPLTDFTLLSRSAKGVKTNSENKITYVEVVNE